MTRESLHALFDNIIIFIQLEQLISCQQRPPLPFDQKTANHVDGTLLDVIMIVWELPFNTNHPLRHLILHNYTCSQRKFCGSVTPTKSSCRGSQWKRLWANCQNSTKKWSHTISVAAVKCQTLPKRSSFLHLSFHRRRRRTWARLLRVLYKWWCEWLQAVHECSYWPRHQHC